MTTEPNLLETQESHRCRLARLFAGQPLDIVPSIQRIGQEPYLEPTDASFAAWLTASLDALQNGLASAADPVTFRPLVLEFWPLGVHYVDAVFGATVRPRDGNFWSDLLSTDLADLAPPDLDSLPLIRWTDAAIRRTLQALPAGALVTTPVLSSPVNIVINLFGERALLDMTSPGPAERRGLQVIADTIASLHRRFLALSADRRVHFYACSFRYAPQGFGHICGCATQLVGPRTYADLLAPLDEQILSVYPDGGTIHLCGHHTQHIPCWSRMPSLRGIEITDAAADDFEHYFRGLRDDQVIYISPTKHMPPDRILAISGGRRIVLQTKLDKPIAICAGNP